MIPGALLETVCFAFFTFFRNVHLERMIQVQLCLGLGGSVWERPGIPGAPVTTLRPPRGQQAAEGGGLAPSCPAASSSIVLPLLSWGGG